MLDSDNQTFSNSHSFYRFTADLPFPQVSLSLNSEMELGSVTERMMNYPTTCSAVIIGGDQFSELGSVFDKVAKLADSIANNILKKPLAIVLFVEEPFDMSMSNHTHALAVPIVRD